MGLKKLKKTTALWVVKSINHILCPGDDGLDGLDVLTALLAESEDVGEEQGGQEQADDLDGLFDADDDEEEYKEGVEDERQDVETEDVASDLFGDVDDIEDEERASGGEARESLDRSREDLQGLCHFPLI